MSQPELFIVLDLCPLPGTPTPLGTDTIAKLIQHPDVQGDHWIRNWQVFTSEEQADRYTEANPSVVKLPLVLDKDAGIAFG